MHKLTSGGMSADNIFAGLPPTALFAGGVPVVEFTSPLELELVDDVVVVNVDVRRCKVLYLKDSKFFADSAI